MCVSIIETVSKERRFKIYEYLKPKISDEMFVCSVTIRRIILAVKGNVFLFLIFRRLVYDFHSNSFRGD